jgi:hypothetical protein
MSKMNRYNAEEKLTILKELEMSQATGVSIIL